MKRQGLYFAVGIGIFLTEAGNLIAEVGADVERFALEQLQRDKVPA